MIKVIAHIDMNSYFASCEQQDNPAWRGLPLGVCEHLGGIIIAPSVEAKKFGVKTAMPVWDARKLCPQIILTKTNPDRYRHYTAKFVRVFEDYTDKVEKYSIDEAFLDITQSCNIKNVGNVTQGMDSRLRGNDSNFEDPWLEAVKIVMEIKRRITDEVGDWLRCSVGLASSKLLAKIGSDMKKPDGLTIIRPEDKEALYDKLKLTDIPGIGARQEQNLNALGIFTLRDLSLRARSDLVRHFGVMGHHLHSMGQLEGSWNESFGELSEIKSMGHTYSIPKNFRAMKFFEPVLYRLCEMVAVRLRQQGLQGFVVHAHAASTSHQWVAGSQKFTVPLQGGREIFLAARSLLLRQRQGPKSWSGIARVGVTLGGLALDVGQQSLFGQEEKRKRLALAVDSINSKYSEQEEPASIRQTSKLGDAHEGLDRAWTIAPLPVLLSRGVIRDSVGFGRMKEFEEWAEVD